MYGDREKCYQCYRPKSSCLCDFVHRVPTKTKFVLLMHPKEFKKVKNNTGFLTHLSLPNSEVFVGIDFSNHHKINEIIQTHNSYILYPSKDAINLSEIKDITTLQSNNTLPMAIFLIDSTWACTKKIFTLSKNLQNLPHLSFTTQKKSIYAIKQQPQEHYLSTIESTLVVLELLGKLGVEKIEKEDKENFLNPFKEMIAYQQELIYNPKHNAVRFKKRKSIL